MIIDGMVALMRKWLKWLETFSQVLQTLEFIFGQEQGNWTIVGEIKFICKGSWEKKVWWVFRTLSLKDDLEIYLSISLYKAVSTLPRRWKYGVTFEEKPIAYCPIPGYIWKIFEEKLPVPIARSRDGSPFRVHLHSSTDLISMFLCCVQFGTKYIL